MALQLLQAPVFHGYTASVFVETSQQLDEQTVRKMLLEAQPQFLEDESPSNELAAGKGEVLLRVTAG